MAARLRVRAIRRGQRPGRRAADRRLRGAERARRGSADDLLPGPSDRFGSRLLARCVRGHLRAARDDPALRPRAQSGMAPPNLRGRGTRSAVLLASGRPGYGRAPSRLHGPRMGHPLPGRPVPGPFRRREEAVRPVADAGVRRGVHPGPHAHARARRVRARAHPAHRPRLWFRPLPARRVRATCGELGSTASRGPPNEHSCSVPWMASTASTSTRSRPPSPASACWWRHFARAASHDSRRLRTFGSTLPPATACCTDAASTSWTSAAAPSNSRTAKASDMPFSPRTWTS